MPFWATRTKPPAFSLLALFLDMAFSCADRSVANCITYARRFFCNLLKASGLNSFRELTFGLELRLQPLFPRDRCGTEWRLRF